MVLRFSLLGPTPCGLGSLLPEQSLRCFENTPSRSLRWLASLTNKLLIRRAQLLAGSADFGCIRLVATTLALILAHTRCCCVALFMPVLVLFVISLSERYSAYTQDYENACQCFFDHCDLLRCR